MCNYIDIEDVRKCITYYNDDGVSSRTYHVGILKYICVQIIEENLPRFKDSPSGPEFESPSFSSSIDCFNYEREHYEPLSYKDYMWCRDESDPSWKYYNRIYSNYVKYTNIVCDCFANEFGKAFIDINSYDVRKDYLLAVGSRIIVNDYLRFTYDYNRFCIHLLYRFLGSDVQSIVNIFERIEFYLLGTNNLNYYNNKYGDDFEDYDNSFYSNCLKLFIEPSNFNILSICFKNTEDKSIYYDIVCDSNLRDFYGHNFVDVRLLYFNNYSLFGHDNCIEYELCIYCDSGRAYRLRRNQVSEYITMYMHYVISFALNRYIIEGGDVNIFSNDFDIKSFSVKYSNDDDDANNRKWYYNNGN